MSSISPYDEALRVIRQNPGTSGAAALAKLLLSLYNEVCGYSFAECVGRLDDSLTHLALRMATSYASHGETDDLRSAGKVVLELYPGLWEMGQAMRDAREATRERWRAEERQAERDMLDAAEAALFTDPAKLIPSTEAKALLDRADPLYGYHNVDGEWRDARLDREKVHAAIDLTGCAELSGNCPEGQMLAVRVDKRIYYVTTDYDAREAYLENTGTMPTVTAPTVSAAKRDGSQ